MLIAGIIGHDGKVQTANLISCILSSTGKKVSVIDSRKLMDLSMQKFKDYAQELKRNNTDFLVIKINIEDLSSEIFDDIRTDIMIYTEKTHEDSSIDNADTGKLMKRVMSLMNEKCIAIVNIDDDELIKLMKGVKNYIISYGFNSKASMTTSSIGDAFICCLQKTIPAQNGVLIEPQEYRIDLQTTVFDSHSIMAAVTFAVLNGVNPNTIGRGKVKM
jgi:UDP-N-acetylmuramate-alanine ligase